MGEVAPLTWWSVAPLSNSAMRADRLSEAWLRLRCDVVLRDVELTLLDAPRVEFVFLPRPR